MEMRSSEPTWKGPRRTLLINEAALAAKVTRRTIYNWLSAGKVEYVRTVGGSIRIYEDSLWRQSPDRDAN